MPYKDIATSVSRNYILKKNSDYFKYCGIGNPKELRELKNIIKKNLSKTTSVLFTYLNTLSISNKIFLISAIMKADGEEIYSILDCGLNDKKLTKTIPKTSEFIKNNMMSICQHVRDDFNPGKFFKSNKFLNATLTEVVKSVLKNQTENTIMLVLLEASRQISDLYLPCYFKGLIVLEILKEIKKTALMQAMLDYSYAAIDYKKGRNNTDIVDLASKQFYAFSKSEFNLLTKRLAIVDPLEYIILDHQASSKLYTIDDYRNIYNAEYKTIFQRRFPNIEFNVLQPSEPLRNDTRRYLETKLATIWLNSKDCNYNAINYFFQEHFGELPDSVELMVSMMTILTNLHPHDMQISGMDLKQVSKAYASKDRKNVRGIPPKESSHKELPKTQIFSGNIGVMRGFQRVLPNEVSSRPLINRVPDSCKPNINKKAAFKGEDIQVFSKENPGVAFTGSLSGHFYSIIAFLNHFLKTGKIRSIEDFFLLFKIITMTYIYRGFHSFIEMYNVIRDDKIFNHIKQTVNSFIQTSTSSRNSKHSKINQLFEDNLLDHLYIPKEILKIAMNETFIIAKANIQQRNIKYELQERLMRKYINDPEGRKIIGKVVHLDVDRKFGIVVPEEDGIDFISAMFFTNERIATEIKKGDRVLFNPTVSKQSGKGFVAENIDKIET